MWGIVGGYQSYGEYTASFFRSEDGDSVFLKDDGVYVYDSIRRYKPEDEHRIRC